MILAVYQVVHKTRHTYTRASLLIKARNLSLLLFLYLSTSKKYRLITPTLAMTSYDGVETTFRLFLTLAYMYKAE